MAKELVSEKGYKIVLKESGEDSEKLGFKGFNPMYRLDMPVRGLLVLTAGSSSLEIISKRYYLVCAGQMDEAEGTMNDLLFHDSRSNRTFPVKRMRKGVKEAELGYRVEGYNEEQNLSLVSAVLSTGRTHQIRAQFAARKHPLAGDGKYGSRVKCPVALMCRELEYKAGEDPEIRTISVPLEDTYPWNLF